MSDDTTAIEGTTPPVRPPHPVRSVETETRTDVTAAVATPPPPPPEHRQWADCIKQQHTHLQGYFASHRPRNPSSSLATQAPAAGMGRLSADLELWGQAVDRAEEQPRLQRYAAAMHDLATTFWEQPPPPAEEEGGDEGPCGERQGQQAPRLSGGHKRPREEGREAHAGAQRSERELNDRLAFCVDCVTSYYLGEAHPLPAQVPTEPHATAGDAKTKQREEEERAVYATLPLLFSREVKAQRRAFFAAHQRVATPLEVEQLLLLQEGEGGGGAAVSAAYRKALTYMQLTRERRAGGPRGAAPPPPLRVLDVGSCYGPFRDRCCPHAVLGGVPLEVLGLDLQPYSSDGGAARAVWQADWLRLRFFDKPAGGEAAEGLLALAQLSAAPTAAEARVTALAAGSFDAVFFCLLLSYLPTARLRYLACLQAYLALRDGGLLVIVSTRTQGSRREDWVGQWTRCLEGVGFARVHLATRKKIVGLSFARVAATPPTALEQALSTEAGRRQWLEAKMALPGAESGLVTLADRNEM